MKSFSLLFSLALAFAGAGQAFAANQYEWDLSGNLNPSVGSGTLSILSSTPATSYPATNVGGQTSGYLSVPKMTSNANEGLTVTAPSSGPNGGSSSYINQYTLVMDIYVPTPASGAYTALFQTQPSNPSGNDADFYLYNSGGNAEIGDSTSLGGYSAAGAFTYNAWNRVVLSVNTSNTADNLAANTAAIYINGTSVYSDTSTTLFGLNGLMSLYSNIQSGPNFLLFNEGDSTTGVYTSPLDVSAIAFTDTNLSPSQISALGAFNPAGVFAVPEPSSWALGLCAVGLLACLRRRAKA